ncbi:MAG: flavodoxin-dependent (E)-4-hydroxy-3-methylbut-2-enyl-diphosphate synthase, partial [Solirubrobacteraceae bacterium]
GLGTLLADGIGDTIRISLSTFHAEEEVKVAWEILKALKLRERGPVLIACPTCGRLQFDMDSIVAEVEERLRAYDEPIEVSVLGCAVNGIGEARHADFGIAGAKDAGIVYAKGEPVKKYTTGNLVDALFDEIDRYYAAGKRVIRDERAAAEAAQWLAENEDETAMTPERLAALEKAAALDGNAGEAQPPARLDESQSPVAGRRFNRA